LESGSWLLSVDLLAEELAARGRCMMQDGRVDANQLEIVSALRSAGAMVSHLHNVGDGCPDLLVGFRGRNFLLEVKTGSGKLNRTQQDWHLLWKGQVAVVRDSIEALSVIFGGRVKSQFRYLEKGSDANV